jgi:UDP-N-acetylmuramate--alanine ligase
MNTDCYHFIGIGGIGMSALAQILLQRGISVSGSDTVSSSLIEELQKRGAKIFIGHNASHIHNPSAIIFSTAIKEENPEVKKARSLQVPFMHRSELLRLLMEGNQPLLVTGTHGKTTTSSLLAHLLVYVGKDPSYAVGGIVRSLNANGGSGKGPYFVAEADESDGSFLKYTPFGAIITNIDNDHLDYWKTEGSLIEGFKQFAGSVLSTEHLFWCGDDEQLCSLKFPGFSYGFDESNAACIKNFSQTGWNNSFDLSFKSIEYQEIEIPLVGAHNILNAASVFCLGLQLEIPETKIREAFSHFKGIERRAELKGECGGISVFDDYAHHPTEIFATLRAIKQAIGKRRLVVAFQPHRYTRTRDCLADFGEAFEKADLLVLTDIYAATEAPIEGITSETVLSKIKETLAIDARYSPRKTLVDTLISLLEPEDVLVTMGAGDITQIGKEVLQKLSLKT